MKNYQKRFDEWNNLKKKIDENKANFQFDEKEIWWCVIGENVGEEICGKNDSFERPVLVLKKFSKNNFLAIPITSSIREGEYFYKINTGGKDRCLALHQAKFLNKKRLLRRVETLSENKFNLVTQSFANLYKIESSSCDELSQAPNGEDALNISNSLNTVKLKM